MVEIKLSVTPDLLRSIAVDLKKSEKNGSENQSLGTETVCFLQNALKTTLSECEHLQVEVDSLIDAGEEAASILSVEN